MSDTCVCGGSTERPNPDCERCQLIARIGRLERLLKNCEYVFQVCWRDLKEWHQFGNYNLRGELNGDRLPIPDPPQRPTEAGVNYTDQNIAVVEEMLQFIHAALKTEE
jgi:hypothetical protein